MAQAMDKHFSIKSDQFERTIKPKILRRTLLAAIAVAGCFVWWAVYGGWLPLVVIGLLAAERAFEWLHIPGTKEIVDSQKVRVTDFGLTLFSQVVDSGLNIPWSSLSASVSRDTDGNISSIKVRGSSLQEQNFELADYENMQELAEIIQQRSGPL